MSITSLISPLDVQSGVHHGEGTGENVGDVESREVIDSDK